MSISYLYYRRVAVGSILSIVKHNEQNICKTKNFLFWIITKQEVEPWCNGKCLPPKVACYKFKSENQILKKKKKNKKKQKTAYKSPLLDPIEVGELYVFEYNLFLLTYTRTQKSLPLRLERDKWAHEMFKNTEF